MGEKNNLESWIREIFPANYSDTFPLNYSDGTATDTNSRITQRTEKEAQVHIDYLKRDLEALQTNLDKLKNDFQQQSTDFAKFKGATEKTLFFQWWAIGILLTAIIACGRHYFLTVIPLVNEQDKKIERLEHKIESLEKADKSINLKNKK